RPCLGGQQARRRVPRQDPGTGGHVDHHAATVLRGVAVRAAQAPGEHTAGVYALAARVADRGLDDLVVSGVEDFGQRGGGVAPAGQQAHLGQITSPNTSRSTHRPPSDCSTRSWKTMSSGLPADPESMSMAYRSSASTNGATDSAGHTSPLAARIWNAQS